jgi:hypothetical protein
MKRKKTYISKNQLKKYGFKIDYNFQTDLKAYRSIIGIGEIKIFNYDYYTIGPDSVLMVDINGERVYEGRCKNRQVFQKIMKRLKINRI